MGARAFLEEIQNQITAFRNAYRGQTTCATTGETLFPSSTHGDHIKEFRYLLDEFLKVEDINSKDVGLESDRVIDSMWTVYQLVKRNLVQRWKDFHMAQATLRLVTRRANLCRGRK